MTSHTGEEVDIHTKVGPDGLGAVRLTGQCCHLVDLEDGTHDTSQAATASTGSASKHILYTMVLLLDNV